MKGTSQTQVLQRMGNRLYQTQVVSPVPDVLRWASLARVLSAAYMRYCVMLLYNSVCNLPHIVLALFVAAGHMHRLHQNGAAYYAPADHFAQNGDEASAATEPMMEDGYADSATHSQGSHGMASKPEQMHKAHNHFAQDRSEDDHTETSSEGTR